MELNDPAVVIATAPPTTYSIGIKSIKVCIIFPNYGGAVFNDLESFIYFLRASGILFAESYGESLTRGNKIQEDQSTHDGLK